MMSPTFSVSSICTLPCSTRMFPLKRSKCHWPRICTSVPRRIRRAIAVVEDRRARQEHLHLLIPLSPDRPASRSRSRTPNILSWSATAQDPRTAPTLFRQCLSRQESPALGSLPDSPEVSGCAAPDATDPLESTRDRRTHRPITALPGRVPLPPLENTPRVSQSRLPLPASLRSSFRSSNASVSMSASETPALLMKFRARSTT